MQSCSLDHVSVWFDDMFSAEGTLYQALDWAYRLRLPLRAVATSARFLNHRPAVREDPSLHVDREPARLVERIKSWGLACADRGVVMETSFWLGGSEVGMEQFLRPFGLCVVDENQPARIVDELLMKSLRHPEVTLLLCPPHGPLMTRVLVLYHHLNPSAGYLESVARLCQFMEVNPIILIVARTEREARLKQSFAEGVCTFLRWHADIDTIVGCDLREAVSRVVSWRNCSHLIIERQDAASWWERRRGEVLEQVRGLCDFLNILALPEGITLEVPHTKTGNRLAQSWDYPHPTASRHI